MPSTELAPASDFSHLFRSYVLILVVHEIELNALFVPR